MHGAQPGPPPSQSRREIAPLPKHQRQLHAQLQHQRVARARHEQLVAQGHARSHAAGVVASSEAVAMLVSMGFAEDRARKALVAHRGSVNEATKALVAEEEETQVEATAQALAGPEEDEQGWQHAAKEAQVAAPVASAPQFEAAPATMPPRVDAASLLDPPSSQAPPATATSVTATLIDDLNVGGGPGPAWLLTPQPGASQDWFATPPPAFGTGGAVISTAPAPLSSAPSAGVPGVGGGMGGSMGGGSKRGGGGSACVMLLPPPPGFTPPSVTAPHATSLPAQAPTNAFESLDLDTLL